MTATESALSREDGVPREEKKMWQFHGVLSARLVGLFVVGPDSWNRCDLRDAGKLRKGPNWQGPSRNPAASGGRLGRLVARRVDHVALALGEGHAPPMGFAAPFFGALIALWIYATWARF